MDTASRTARLHPLVAVAAVSVIGFSATGVGVMTGLIPSSLGSHAKIGASAPQNLSVAELMPAAASSVPAYAAATRMAAEPAPASRPAPSRKAVAAKPAEPAPAPVKLASSDPVPLPSPVPAATLPPPPPAVAPLPSAVVEAPKCLDCGVVESVREVEQKGEGSWMGPVAGGIGGAILGKQMGKGTGNTIMTVIGAAGGAYAGHEIEKRVRSTKQWVVNVRMNDGSSRTLAYPSQPQWQGGEKVRMENGTLVPDQKA